MLSPDVSKLPFNIELLHLSQEDISKFKKINNMAIFSSETNSFHSEGLFSTEIFGMVGSEYRSRVFSYIDLKINILHPFMYYLIIKSVAWYEDILSGKTYAVWNPKAKQFEKSNQIEGKTGYDFFFNHIEELKIEPTESIKRDFNISLIKKSIVEQTYKMQYLLVLPAGLRDYTVDATGAPQEDEINTFYRKVFNQTNLIDPALYKINPESLNSVRFTIQRQVNAIFDYLKSLLEGKHKLILGKWLTRKTFNSTRNVASSNIEKVTSLNDPSRLKFNETQVGLHQFLKLLMPKTIHDIKTNMLTNVFNPNSEIATLVNSKTLKKETIAISDLVKDYDTFMSSDGLEKYIANYSNLNIRHNFVTLNNGKHFLYLIYKDDKFFKLIQDIDEVPSTFNRDKVTPITMTEFLYLSTYKNDSKIPAFVTRYPISSYGSIYPAYLKLKTTSETLALVELDDNWEPSENTASSFPIYGLEFFNTTSVHPSHVSRLALDYDGDTLSIQAVLTDEAIEEVSKTLNSKEYYLSPEGNFYFSLSNDILNMNLAYMTG